MMCGVKIAFALIQFGQVVGCYLNKKNDMGTVIQTWTRNGLGLNPSSVQQSHTSRWMT